eukprot:861347-Karenia_brevis.AAC.1
MESSREMTMMTSKTSMSIIRRVDNCQSEHPVLMQEEERARCRPLSDADDELLRAGLADALPQL